jgi:phosphatidylinositol alpha-1,6-mannosyltransferase
VSEGRILLLSEIFPPQCGGSGRWFWEIYRRLPREQVTIVAGEDSRAAEFDRTHDLRLLRLPLAMREWGVRSLTGLGGYCRTFRALRRLVRSAGATQVHCGRCLPEGWVAWLLKQLCGVPYVCYVHGEELNTASVSREFTWMVRRVFGAADYVIANSQNTRRVLREDWKLSDDRVRQLYPGVDASRFVPAARDRAVRDRLGWADRPVVLTVGRLQKRKGQDTLIRALPEIRRAVPDVLYAIAGAGEERPALERLVREHQLAEHVQFMGEIDDDTLVACYQQCDLFALPNRTVDGDFEGFGMVLVEAQACGRPVVAGASGGTAETMSIPATGRVVSCDGPEQLAAVLGELLQDSALRERMGRVARSWAESRFDWTAQSGQAARWFGVGNRPLGPVELSRRIGEVGRMGPVGQVDGLLGEAASGG